MFPVAQVGPFAVQMPGLILLGGLWIGLYLSEQALPRRRNAITAAQLNNLVFTALLVGLIGARLGYVFRFPSAFAQSPLSLISLNPDLLEPWIGLFTAAIAAVVYGQRNGLTLLPTLDALTPLLAAFSIVWHLSQLASGAGYGLPSDLPWAINLLGANRHPTQIYDALASLVILAIIWSRRKQFETTPGQTFFAFVVLSAGARLLLDAFDAAGPALATGWRVSQIAAWAILFAGLLFLRRLKFQGE
ncbi:MAG: prolipoprotein diacylglyceryl transferase [Anaerolineales bacterium]